MKKQAVEKNTENAVFAENECDDSCRRPPIRYKRQLLINITDIKICM